MRIIAVLALVTMGACGNNYYAAEQRECQETLHIARSASDSIRVLTFRPDNRFGAPACSALLHTDSTR